MPASAEVEGSRHKSGVQEGAQLWDTIREQVASARSWQEVNGNERLPGQGT
jgi:hypothetical protein